MKFSINRESLLKPLQLVSGAVERRHNLPILSNVLLEVSDNLLKLTGTDLEVELIGQTTLEGEIIAGRTTVPARKFLDICRSLPDLVDIQIEQQENRLMIRSGRSRFNLTTLPADDYPNMGDWQHEMEFTLKQGQLKQLIEATQFSMANQDVRYYLNGMLFETDNKLLRTVATDGHRLAVAYRNIDAELPQKQVIVPRKGVVELVRLFDEEDSDITLSIGNGNIRAIADDAILTSKLVDGRFPDYRRVLPQGGDKVLIADRAVLKQAFVRAAILSNEKFRGVRLNLDNNELKITANNPEQEEAVEMVDVEFPHSDLEIGFNVSYVLDVLNALKRDQVKLVMSDANSSALFENVEDDEALYVVMPMRL
ncbi:DNA polymerase III subunit beta [Ferrimonas aestuarii]|uniref:Beta sliding clamp n=1 Tax=Ferrimonas aestuarii TaxID=2569539 RepID=A0A4U1BP52_9GAMM|nr:DNA polymerase III subunit beta [Ferrimonas aestuarii]TKB51896.1 DNA polymerase III subunit beta [Ferrimonas aestuarii]